MSECYNFSTKDGAWEFTVKSEFLKKCPNPTDVSVKDLLTVEKIINFLHNPSGPAIIRKRDNMMVYWIDGKMLEGDEAAKIEHGFKFNNKLMDTIADEQSK